MSQQFEGKVAVVTGAGSGIGAATADAFLAAGATVILVDLNAELLAARGLELDERHADRHIEVVADVSETAAVVQKVQSHLAAGNGVDHLVNCAASFVAAGTEATQADWVRALDVNVIGSARLTAALSARMPRGATVVNVASISAHVAQRDRWTYNASKAAILALTRGQAMDLAPLGVRVNAVSPGWIWTAEVAKAAEGDRDRWEPVWGRYHMLERLGEPSEVADAILYLSSERASFITGTELLVDGGYSAMGPEGLGHDAHFAGSQ